MEAATPGGTARAEDPGLNAVKEAAEAVPPGKRPPQWKSATSCYRQKSVMPSYERHHAF